VLAVSDPVTANRWTPGRFTRIGRDDTERSSNLRLGGSSHPVVAPFEAVVHPVREILTSWVPRAP
jgi:hypothetical protein